MTRMSTAKLTRPSVFPHEPGEPLWQERRAVPVALFVAVPVASLATAAGTSSALGLQVLLGAATVVGVLMMFRLRRGSLIETYTVTDRFITIEQPSGGRAAIETDGLTAVTLDGDAVRIEGRAGVLTFGFVRRQKRLVRTLQRLAPAVQVTRESTCPARPERSGSRGAGRAPRTLDRQEDAPAGQRAAAATLPEAGDSTGLA
jgi:hypothetical protein